MATERDLKATVRDLQESIRFIALNWSKGDLAAAVNLAEARAKAADHVLVEQEVEQTLYCSKCLAVVTADGKGAFVSSGGDACDDNEQHDGEFLISDGSFVKAAKAEYHSEGEIEIDEGAVVSRGTDSGAYVAAWVWVDAGICAKERKSQPLCK